MRNLYLARRTQEPALEQGARWEGGQSRRARTQDRLLPSSMVGVTPWPGLLCNQVVGKIGMNQDHRGIECIELNISTLI